MNIIANFDSSVSGAPAGFKSAVAAAISYLDSVFTNSVTITINFGWGEINGQSIPSNDVARSSYFGNFYNYSQIVSALNSHATSAADLSSVATLPRTDPTGGGRFFVTDAEANVLGLSSAPATGYVGLNATLNYTFDPLNRVVAGAHDAIGAIEHEITEIMGRTAWHGTYFSSQSTNTYGILDLFRYSPSGALDTLSNAYFSVDGGRTLLTQFNDATNGGDVGDWIPSLRGDSFGNNYTGIATLVTPTDLTVMDVLGYSVASSSTPINNAQASAILLQSFITGISPSASDYTRTLNTATFFINQASGNVAAAWQQLGAAFADEPRYNSSFLQKYGALSDAQFVNAVYRDIFNNTAPSSGSAGFLLNELNYYEAVYRPYFDAGDPNGVTRARGTMIGDLFQQIEDVRNGHFTDNPYYAAEQRFASEIALGTAHFGTLGGLFM